MILAIPDIKVQFRRPDTKDLPGKWANKDYAALQDLPVIVMLVKKVLPALPVLKE